MVWFGALASGVKKFGEEAKAKDVSVAAEAKANAEAKKSLLEELKDTDREVYNDQVRVYRTKSGRRIALQNKLDVA